MVIAGYTGNISSHTHLVGNYGFDLCLIFQYLDDVPDWQVLNKAKAKLLFDAATPKSE